MIENLLLQIEFKGKKEKGVQLVLQHCVSCCS